MIELKSVVDCGDTHPHMIEVKSVVDCGDTHPHMIEVKSVVDCGDTHPHMIVFCEIKPKNFLGAPSTTEFLLSGYSLFHSNVDTKNGRGVSFYISNISTATLIVLCDEFCESVWVTIPLKGSDKLLIGCIYHSPTQQCGLNNARLCNVLLRASNIKHVSHILIMGDFNLSLVNWSSWTCSNNSENSFDNTFITCLRDSFFHKHVTIPTHSRYSQNSSILDLILTNEEGMISSLSYLSPCGKVTTLFSPSIFTATYNTEDTTECDTTTKNETTLP